MENFEYREVIKYEPKADFAQRFLENRLNDNDPIFIGDKTRRYKIFEQDVNIEGLENVKFIVDFREPNDKESGRPNQLRFDYIGKDEKTDQEIRIAEMHFDVLDSNHLVLVHRYVRPEFRGTKGLGTKLLETSEQWLQSISQLSNNSVKVDLESGQQSVIKWALARGFAIDKNQLDIYKEIEQHPEHFVEDEVILSQESQDNKVVKAPYTFRVGQEGRYVEDAIRIKLSKSIGKPE